MTDFDSVKDSGERQEWETGSRRDTRDGKGRYDLIPPLFMHRLARHLENGAVKYGDKNWELGQPLSRYLDSALRHTYKVLALAVDEDHPAAGVWNLMAFLCTAEWIREGRLPRDLDDIGYCDALDERDEDAHLDDPIPFTLADDEEHGGRPYVAPEVAEADMAVSEFEHRGRPTTVVSDGDRVDLDVDPLRARGLDIGYLDDPEDFRRNLVPNPGISWDTLAPYVPAWVPRTIEFEVSPLKQETIDLLRGARFQAGPPAETVDLGTLIEHVRTVTRALAEYALPVRYVAGIGTEEALESLKAQATHAVPAAAEFLKGDVTLGGIPVYEVDADDPILAGQPWAIVPEDWARAAVQRSLDRD